MVKSYDAIVIEDLNMKAMSQCLNFGKSVGDNAWGMFTTFLRYKLENEGKLLVRVDNGFLHPRSVMSVGKSRRNYNYQIESGFVNPVVA